MFILRRSINNTTQLNNEDYLSNSLTKENLLEKENSFYCIDEWKKSNIKNLVYLFKKNAYENKDFYFYFKKWNWNLDFLYNQLNLKIDDKSFDFSINLINALKNNDVVKAYIIFKEINDEEKIGTLLKIFKDYELKDFYILLNNSLNENYLNFNNVFTLSIFEIFGKVINE